ncbi:MAG: hypothetical protein J6C12_12285, partial [Lachnospiraceae bacterium]|nr:hypothetical protein [Lachnospiraceae bacterium]
SATTFLQREYYAVETCKNEEFPSAILGNGSCIFRYLRLAKNTHIRKQNPWQFATFSHNH